MSAPAPTPTNGNWMSVNPTPYPSYPYSYSYGNRENCDTSGLQHQMISGDIHSAARENLQSTFAVTRDVNGGISGLTRDVNGGVSAILGGIDSAQNSIKDSAQGHSLAIMNNAASVSRDILTAVERNGGDTRTSVERNGSDTRTSVERNGSDTRTSVERNGGDTRTTVEKTSAAIMGSIERNAGEGRLTTVVTDAATRQFNSDMFRDVSVAVERNGNSIRAAESQNSFEIRKDISIVDRDVLLTSKDQLLESYRNKECLAAQAAANFNALQLEQHKIKECLTLQLQDAKYEALKNKEALTAQLAECCCELKMHGKEHYGALKSQINDKSCDIINAFSHTETTRLRDALNKCEFENIARNVARESQCCSDPCARSRSGSRSR